MIACDRISGKKPYLILCSQNSVCLVASFASIARSGTLAGLPPVVDWVEILADAATATDANRWRQAFRGRLIFARSSRTPTDAVASTRSERRQQLVAAAQQFDLVELQADDDLDAQLLAQIPAAQRLISWRGQAASVATLRERFAEMARTPARLYKLVTTGSETIDETLAPLALLHDLKRQDVIAYASGEAGFWTRLIAPRLGCPMVFARGQGQDQKGNAEQPNHTQPAPGRPKLEQLIDDYGLPALPEVQQLFGLVGQGVLRSLSPRLHNAAYRALGLPALYLPFSCDDFTAFWNRLIEGDFLQNLGLPLAGLTVVAPNKEAAHRVAGRGDGAANLMVRTNGAGWTADSTDPQGVLDPLERIGIEVEGRSAAVLGCGGAGRSIAAGLDQAGARVVLVNRGRDRGRKAALQLDLPFVALKDFDPRGFDLVIHATPVGRQAEDPPPLEVDRLDRDTVVVDLVYAGQPTTLATSARDRQLSVIDGLEVLLAQTRRQFYRMTGEEISLDQLRGFLGTVH